MVRSRTKSTFNWDDMAEALKSVAHPERVAILNLISSSGDEQVKVKNIYETLHLEQSITSRHLTTMKKSGVLKRKVKKGKVFYHLNMESITAQFVKMLLTQRQNNS
jgi:predicted transcriptional regulator